MKKTSRIIKPKKKRTLKKIIQAVRDSERITAKDLAVTITRCDP